MKYRINWNRVAFLLFYVSLLSSIVLGIDSLAWICILGFFAILGCGVSDYLTGGDDELTTNSRMAVKIVASFVDCLGLGCACWRGESRGALCPFLVVRYAAQWQRRGSCYSVADCF